MGLKEARALEKTMGESKAKKKLYSKELEQMIAKILLSFDESGYAKHDSSRTPNQVVDLMRRAKRSRKVGKQSKDHIAFVLERIKR